MIDRQPEAGLETSFANGGQVSVSHAEPWANPAAPFKVLKWLFDSDAPLLFRPTLDMHQWLWMAHSWSIACRIAPTGTPPRSSSSRLESRRLIQEIRSEGPPLRRAHQRHPAFLSRQARIRGRDPGRRIDAQVRLRPQRDRCRKAVRDRARLRRAAEPTSSARPTRRTMKAATRSNTRRRSPASASGWARLPLRHAVSPRSTPTARADTCNAVEMRTAARATAHLRARDVVVSLGCYSAPFLRPYGVRLNIYPAKGYSVTIPIDGSNAAPVTSLTDDEYKLVYSNLGDRLRVAGTADCRAIQRDLNIAALRGDPAQCAQPVSACGRFRHAPPSGPGLRPATPSNIPYVGPHALSQSLAQHRPRHARLDAGRGLRLSRGEHDRGE